MRVPPTTPEELARWLDLAAGRPDIVGQQSGYLPAVKPGIALVRWGCAIGHHHEQYRPLNVLEGVTVTLEGHAPTFEAALAALHGPPVTIVRPATRPRWQSPLPTPDLLVPLTEYRRYGTWLVGDRDQASEIVWYRYLPEWARDPVDEPARRAALASWLGSADDRAWVVADLVTPRAAGIHWTVHGETCLAVLSPCLPLPTVLELASLDPREVNWSQVGVHLAGWELLPRHAPAVSQRMWRLTRGRFYLSVTLSGLFRGSADGVDETDRIERIELREGAQFVEDL